MGAAGTKKKKGARRAPAAPGNALRMQQARSSPEVPRVTSANDAPEDCDDFGVFDRARTLAELMALDPEDSDAVERFRQRTRVDPPPGPDDIVRGRAVALYLAEAFSPNFAHWTDRSLVLAVSDRRKARWDEIRRMAAVFDVGANGPRAQVMAFIDATVEHIKFVQRLVRFPSRLVGPAPDHQAWAESQTRTLIDQLTLIAGEFAGLRGREADVWRLLWLRKQGPQKLECPGIAAALSMMTGAFGDKRRTNPNAYGNYAKSIAKKYRQAYARARTASKPKR